MLQKFILRILAIIIPLCIANNSIAQRTVYINLSDIFPIQDFTLVQADELEIHALTKEGKIDVDIEGNYKFVINGYIEKLDFKNGKAILPGKIVENSILFIKHEQKADTIQHLFYSISDWVIPIPFWILWVIPLLIIVIVFIVKRFIYLFLILLVLMFFIGQGLNLRDYFSIILDSIKGLFSLN